MPWKDCQLQNTEAHHFYKRDAGNSIGQDKESRTKRVGVNKNLKGASVKEAPFNFNYLLSCNFIRLAHPRYVWLLRQMNARPRGFELLPGRQRYGELRLAHLQVAEFFGYATCR